MKKYRIFLTALVIVIFLLGWPIYQWYKKSLGPDTCGGMSRSEAIKIAKESQCMNNGKLAPFGYSCNEVTGTWWFNLSVKQKGCFPACVVNIGSKQAEVNPSCTGIYPE